MSAPTGDQAAALVLRSALAPGDVERAAVTIHRHVCPDCWGWPDCPDPAEWDRTMAAARAVLLHRLGGAS